MAKKSQIIETTATIKSITVGIHTDDVHFTALSLEAKDNVCMSNMIKEEAKVLVTMDLPEPDEQFPPVQSVAVVKGYTINKTCDNPKFRGLSFSTDQVALLTNYIRTEQELKLRFEVTQQELDFEGRNEEEPE